MKGSKSLFSDAAAFVIGVRHPELVSGSPGWFKKV
jgi:hypothetical protein